MIHIAMAIIATYGSTVLLFILCSCLLIAKKTNVFSCDNYKSKRESRRNNTIINKSQGFDNNKIEESVSIDVKKSNTGSVSIEEKLNSIECDEGDRSKIKVRFSSDEQRSENDKEMDIDTCAEDDTVTNVCVAKIVIAVVEKRDSDNDVILKEIGDVKDAVDKCNVQTIQAAVEEDKE